MIASAQSGNIDPDRNCLEIIRFASNDDRARGFDALVGRGKFSISSSQLNVWNVRTDVVRALLAAGVRFEWLSRDAQ
jgi:hypothetical protein